MSQFNAPARPDWAGELLSESSWELLITLLITELERRGRTIIAVSPDAITMRDKRDAEGEARLGFSSLVHRAVGTPPSRWPEMINHLIEILEAVDPNGLLEGLATDQLRLRVVVPGALVRDSFLLREFAPGLGIVLVADASETLSYLDADEAGGRLGLDRQALESAGVAGLLAYTEPKLLPVDDAPFPLFHVAMRAADESSYAASGLLCLEQLGVDSTLGAIVSAPASGACFVSPLDADAPWERLGPLFAFTRSIAVNSQHPLPPRLYWWHDGRFDPIEALVGEHEGGEAIIVTPPPSLLARYGEPVEGAPGDTGRLN